jgi:hypothetical protein
MVVTFSEDTVIKLSPSVFALCFISLQSTADPLGPQPEPPKEWRDIDAMGRRVTSKERTLQSNIKEMKHSAKTLGLSLITVSSEKVTTMTVGQDPVSKKQDDSILDFLSKY